MSVCMHMCIGTHTYIHMYVLTLLSAIISVHNICDCGFDITDMYNHPMIAFCHFFHCAEGGVTWTPRAANNSQVS